MLLVNSQTHLVMLVVVVVDGERNFHDWRNLRRVVLRVEGGLLYFHSQASYLVVLLQYPLRSYF